MKKNPGIFNDVIGPVMRGPSSSHTAASWRIARICMEILNEPLKNALIDFDKNGIWASNYLEQGTVMGINGGLLGLEITDPQMKNTNQLIKKRGLSINYEVNSFPTKHPNTVRLSLEGKAGNKIKVITVSLGGGSFEIQQIADINVNVRGDYFELLLLNKNKDSIPDEIKNIISKNKSLFQSINQHDTLINIKSSKEIPKEIIKKIKSHSFFDKIILLQPILPIVSGNKTEIPFTTINSMLNYAKKEKLDLGDIGLTYEKCLSGLRKLNFFQR